MADGNILTDAEKLKKVVDMASQQNSKSYGATNPVESKKAVEESPKGSTIVYNEMPQLDNHTLMSKEHADAINNENNKSIKKQIKKKREVGINELKSEIAELKEIMRLQIEVDKMRKNQQVYNIPSRKDEKMDGEGYIDLTKEASPVNVYRKDDMIMMSPKVQTPYGAGVRNPLPVSREKSLSSEVKLALDDKTIPNPIMDKDKKKVSDGYYIIRWIVYSALVFTIFFGLLKFVLNSNYLISSVISLVITFGFSLTYYLLKVKVSDHQMKKEVVHYNDFEMAEAKRCGKCGDKLIKSKVIQNADGYRQFIKCKNIACDFQKTIEIKKENGY